MALSERLPPSDRLARMPSSQIGDKSNPGKRVLHFLGDQKITSEEALEE